MNVAYVYPWDVAGDPSAAARIADLGVEAVALAASYHSTRAATPYHPSHRVLDALHSAFYLPVRPAAWGRLVPGSPTWTPADSYLIARDALKEQGLQVQAWTVLTHNAHLGTKFPDLVVRNAFGDPYPYALCPAHPDVQDYCANLVRETLDLGAPDALILEACGPMGFGHQGTHEKTAGADWSAVDGDLLTLCFCTACADRYPPGTRDRVREAVGSGFGSVEEALGELTAEVREVRVSLSADLREKLIAAAPGVPVTLHANPDPWAASSFAALPEGEPGAEVLVGNCWGEVEPDCARLSRLAELATPGQRVGAYVLALPPRAADAKELAAMMRAYREAGADELHLYHAGLASPQRLAAMAEALRHL
ncbi:hypothetical protein ACIBG8_50880 [Nonomuraea sp. NPDC050556]|uniref:hypothetical protein n=1 Tax=Nonomuraea sp. NPDC050556 TaxID=3364369 RepID=UPI003790FD66